MLQVIDYAIARRIVDLHSGSMEDMERMYTADEIQRYITFARQFKPQVGDGAYEHCSRHVVNSLSVSIPSLYVLLEYHMRIGLPEEIFSVISTMYNIYK